MQLFFRTEGHGEPLLIIHGLLGSSDNWAHLSRRFSETFHVLTMDLRNHGRSPHVEEMSYSAMATDIVELMNSQQLACAHLLGHSMGGKVAMQFAALYPDRIRKLIVADMSPRVTPPRNLELLRLMNALDLSRFTSRTEVDHALTAQASSTPVRQFILKNIARAADGKLSWKPNVTVLLQNHERLGQAISMPENFHTPTLFVRGEKSDYIGADDERVIRELFQSVRMETIAGAGHWVHADAPEAFYQVVKNFLREASA